MLPLILRNCNTASRMGVNFRVPVARRPAYQGENAVCRRYHGVGIGEGCVL